MTLQPLGLQTMTILDGSFGFEEVPDGTYFLIVSPGCTPFGCFEPTPVTLAGAPVLDIVIAPLAFTPTPTPTDIDQDGCSNAAELGTNPGLGGLREPDDFWDFFDTPNPNADPQRDRGINIADIFRVAARFGMTGDPNVDPLSTPPKTGYHPAYDRGPQNGANSWDRAPADGGIAIGDIFAVAQQFGHDCS